jgi:SAM-dependent methyltransferase
MSESRYLHGTAPEEQRRLARLNEVLNAASLRELAPGRGESVLDVGCGLAQLTRDIARAVGPTGRVLGIERSAEQLAEAGRLAAETGEADLVELRPGSAEALPLRPDEWGSFDTAHARFLLEHVRDPLAVVREMVRAVRPGGRIVLEDDNHDTMRLWPEPPGFAPLWQAYVRSYDRLGNDPLVGHRLVSLLWQAGAAPRRNTLIFFGRCSGSADFHPYVENLMGLLAGARDAILETGMVDPPAFENGIAALREWKRRPDAAMWLSVSWAEGVRGDSEA